MMSSYRRRRKYFPDPAADTVDGIVAMGDELSVDILLEAYSFGIFPWPHPELPCLWFCPDERGVIEFDELHVPKSLVKLYKKQLYRFTFDQAFDDVMKACATVPRPGQDGTWITSPLLKMYSEFHRAGYAHSVEVWRENRLVGGIYGVYVGGVFSGESMFFKESNTSKLALLHLIEHLRDGGLTWLDIQMVTPVTEALGGKYISKKEFLTKLKAAHLSVGAESGEKKFSWG